MLGNDGSILVSRRHAVRKNATRRRCNERRPLLDFRLQPSNLRACLASETYPPGQRLLRT